LQETTAFVEKFKVRVDGLGDETKPRMALQDLMMYLPAVGEFLSQLGILMVEAMLVFAVSSQSVDTAKAAVRKQLSDVAACRFGMHEHQIQHQLLEKAKQIMG
jgi:hypothetical protein